MLDSGSGDAHVRLRQTGQPDGLLPIVMHWAPSGLYVELVDRSLRECCSGKTLPRVN